MVHIPEPADVMAVSLLFIILCSISVALRFYARKLKILQLGTDDWLTLASYFMVMGLLGLMLWNSIHGHLDRTLIELTPEQRTEYLKRLVTEGIVSYISIGTTKISIIFFYLRVFTVPKFKPWAYSALILTVIWMLGALFTLAFSRGPDVTNLWTNRVPVTNLWSPKAQVGFNVMDILVDIYILCLPIPLIWNLKISRRKKITLFGILWLGMLCVVASVVRLYYSIVRLSAPPIARMTPAQFKTIIINTSLWSAIEPACSLIAACLPTLGPLLKDDLSLHTVVQGAASWISRAKSSVTSLLSANRSQHSGRNGSRIYEDSHDAEQGTYQLQVQPKLSADSSAQVTISGK